MKKIILLALMCVSMAAQGQTTRSGNTFIQTKKTATRDTVITKYNYQTTDGKTHRIILNRKSGACYIWKVSKNGKGYRQYMSKDITETINREMKG